MTIAYRSLRSGLLLCALGVRLLAVPPVARADSPDAPPAPVDPVDSGTKKLMAANGLFQRGLFKLAAEQYQQFLSEFPKHEQAPAARYGLGLCDYRLGDFAGAVPLLRQVADDARTQQKDEVLAVLGYCELSNHQYDAAIGDLDTLINKFPRSAQLDAATLYRAQALYLGGKSREASDACRAYLSARPQGTERPTAIYFLALSQKALGENADALKSLDDLERNYPQSSYRFDSRLLAGQILEADGKRDAAIEQYRQLLTIAPKDRADDAHYTLGVALSRAGNFDEAIKELSAVGQGAATPLAGPAKLELGLAQLSGGKLSDARATLSAVVLNDPARAPGAQFGLAQCDIAEKNYSAALATLESLSQQKPPPANLTQIQLYRGICLMESSKPEEALGVFDDLLAKSPSAAEAPQAMYRAAYCLHRLKQYDQSHQRCLQVARLPESPVTRASAELDAENLFLMLKYADAQPAFDALAASAKGDSQRLFRLRGAECDYFTANYQKAIDRLTPLASDEQTAAAPDLHQAIFLLGDAQLQLGKYADSAANLKRFISLGDSDTSEAQYKLSVALLRLNDQAAATAILEKLSSADPSSPWVQRGWLELAQLRYAGGAANASQTIDKLLSSGPREDLAAPAKYLLGWIRFDDKKFDAAAQLWKQVRTDYPRQPAALDAALQEGVALKEANHPDEAVSALEAFASEHPEAANAAKARQVAASILNSQGKNKEAAALLAELAKQQSAGPTVLYDLAWSQRRAGQTADAEATYRRLLEQPGLGDLGPAARTELAELLYARKAFADATKFLETVVADSKAPEKVLVTATYRLAWCYQKLGNFESAGKTFRSFASKWPTDALAPSATLQAALADADGGREDQSRQALVQMLKDFPDSKDAPVAWLKLAEVEAAEGDFDESSKTEQQFLTKYPQDPLAYRAHFGIGWALENQKHYPDARASYQKVISATNGETAARAQFQIGETYLAERNYEQAVSSYLAVEDVYAYSKWSARALFEAGRCFEQLKQPDQARQQYTQLVTKYKNAPEAELAQERLKAAPGS